MSGPARARRERLRVVVLGYVVRGPVGGLAWHHLQYALGLARLGHDVWFVEDSDDYPGCYDPRAGSALGTDPTYGLAFAAAAFDRLGLGGRWAYHDAHRGAWHGPAAAHARATVRAADVVLNVSGMDPLREWAERVPRRVLVDTDPAFTQLRHLRDPAARALAARHTHFVTFGENVGRAGCTIPDDGLPWRPTRQPVVLDAWPVTPAPADGAFTTVMQWESYAAREHEGRRFGMKGESFAPYLDLPRATGERLELALGGATAPREALAARGWRLADPLAVARDPWSYQRYLGGSKGEFGVAKHGYVATGSGWFSERTAAYLASGRPAVVQDTGFTRWLDAPAGVLAFDTPAGAADALARVAADHAHHCRAAREVAARYFDADRVLDDLLDHASGSPDAIVDVAPPSANTSAAAVP